MDHGAEASSEEAPRRDRRGIVRAVVLRVALVLGIPVALIEGALTVAVHADVAPDSALLNALRSPWIHGSYSTDEQYWELRFLRKPPGARVDNPERDGKLGWTSDSSPHLADLAGGSAPAADLPDMLLVGDSYARGVYPDTWHDFESLAASSGLALEYDFFNAGVGGYGFDQICLMAEREIERREPRSAWSRRPILLASLLLDDDLDRCVLAFRDWPKPRFSVDSDGRLQPVQAEVPTVAEYFEHEARIGPPFTPWLAWQVVRKLGGVPHREYGAQEKQALARALIGRLAERAESAGYDVMFVLFRHSSSIADADELGWRLDFMERELRARGLPWVDVRPAFAQHMQASGLSVEDYFLPPDHPTSGHYDALGDALAFQAILQGLKDHFGAGPGGNLFVVQDARPLPDAAGGAPPRWIAYDERLMGIGLRPPYLHAAGAPGQAVGLSLAGSTVPGIVQAQACVLGSPSGRAAIEIRRNGALDRTVFLEGREPVGVELSVGASDTVEVRIGAATASGEGGLELVLSEVDYEPSARVKPALR